MRTGTLSIAALVDVDNEGVNLDCDWPDNLRDFAADVAEDKQAVADLIFPSKPERYLVATELLGEYAKTKALAMGHRLSGNIQQAVYAEAVCDRIYKNLPEFARW